MLDWRRVTAPPGEAPVWTADGVYERQWYSVKRTHEKWWVAVFHDHDGSGPITQQLGHGPFTAVKKACRTHADRIEADTLKRVR